MDPHFYKILNRAIDLLIIKIFNMSLIIQNKQGNGIYNSITQFYIINNRLFKKNNICKYKNLKMDTFLNLIKL